MSLAQLHAAGPTVHALPRAEQCAYADMVTEANMVDEPFVRDRRGNLALMATRAANAERVLVEYAQWREQSCAKYTRSANR